MTHLLFGLMMAPAEGGSPMTALFVQLGLIFMIFYWLLIRPQKKEKGAAPGDDRYAEEGR